MTVDDVARLLDIVRSSAHERVRRLYASQAVPVRIERHGRGRPRYVVDATEDELLFALNRLPLAA